MRYPPYTKNIREAVLCLIKQDWYLLTHSVNERSQTHKLGEYLQQALSAYNIDCEYNRMVDASGEVVAKLINLEELYAAMQNVRFDQYPELRETLRMPEGEPAEDARGRIAYFVVNGEEKKRIYPIYPDIICHHRGTDNNRFVIEAKKSSNDPGANNFDFIKLIAMVTQLGYKFAYYLEFPDGKDKAYYDSLTLRNINVEKLFSASRLPIYKITVA